MSSSLSNDDDDGYTEVDERLIYTTSDGFEIPPEWETSCLMALDVQRLIEAEEKAKEHRLNGNEDPAGEHNEVKIVSPEDVLVIADFATLFKSHEEECKRYDENLRKYAAQERADEDGKEAEEEEEEEEEEVGEENRKLQQQGQNQQQPTTFKHSEEPQSKLQPPQQQRQVQEQDRENEQGEDEESFDFCGEGDADDDDEVAATMQDMTMMRSASALGLQREDTDPSQWKLEEIILRKSVAVRHDDVDVDVEDDDDLARAVGHSATKKQKAHKEFSYLCKWAPGGRCTTWELRSVLVEEGFGPQVGAFDLRIKEKGITQPKERVDEFKPPCAFGKVALRLSSQAGKGKTRADRDLLPHESFFEKLLPNWKHDIVQLFANDGMRVVRVCRVAPLRPANRFISHLASLPERTKVQIVFHGTSTPGIHGICESGLVVPGKLGVTVANGSAYGIVIYSAAKPCVSVGYDRTGQSVMFVCVGIPTAKNIHGDFVCFAEEQKVCPVWLVQYEKRDGTTVDSYRDKPGGEIDLPMCSSFADFMKAVNFVNRSGNQGVADQQGLPPLGTKMSSHVKKLLRQKRQMLGLSRISL